MPAFVPILFRIDGSYLIPISIQHTGSKFMDIEFIPRELLEALVAQGKTNGQVVEPVINYGFH